MKKSNIEKEKKIKEYYTVQVRCSNCSYGYGFKKTLNIEKGVRAHTKIDTTPCPNCGCYTLVKKIK